MIVVLRGPLYAVLAQAGLAESNAAARRKIVLGKLKVDGVQQDLPSKVLEPGVYALQIGQTQPWWVHVI
jgi:ribosomal protein S4